MRIKNDIKITFVEARDLLAMDKNFTTSDPYVKIKDVKGLHLPGNDDLYRTKVVKKNLNPKWGESFNLHFDDRLSKLNFLVYDYEVMSRDARIGKVRLNADQLFPTTSGSHAVIDRWLPLKPKGELHVIIEVHWRIPIALPGVSFPIPVAPSFSVGLGWDMAKKGKVVDLDASVAALNDAGAIIDSVSFKKLTGMNGAVRHSGDDRSGDGDGDDEVITFNTNALNPEFSRFVIVINSFTLVPLSQTRSAYVRVSSPYKGTVAFFRINSFTNNTGLLLGQLWRTSEGWFFSSGKESGPGRTITESMSWVIPHATGSHGAKAISPQPNAFVDNTAQHYGAPPTPPGVQGYTGPQPGQTPPLQGYGVPPSAAGYTSPQGYAQGYGQPYGTAPAGQGYYAPQVHGYYSPPQGNYAPSLQGYAQQGAQQQYHAPPPGAPQGYYGDPQGYPGARQ